MAEPSFSRQKVLQSYSQDLYHQSRSLILSFAVLGYTDVASRLLSKQDAYDKLHGVHVWLRPLWFLWDTLGAWPEGEKEAVYKFVKEKRKREHGSDTRDGEPASKQARVDEEAGEVTDEDVKKMLDRLAADYARGWWWSGKRDGTAQGPHERELSAPEKKETIKNILKGIDEKEPAAFKNAHTGAMAMDVSSGLVSALDLALSLSPSETDDSSTPCTEDILGRISKRMGANQQIQYLAQSRRAWASLFKNGALAKALNLDTSKVTSFAEEIDSIVTERFTNGKLSLSDLPMRRILELLDHHAHHNPSAQAEDASPYQTAEPLFRTPASPSEIADLEKALEITLPDDYKEFLAISNGFGHMFNGIIYEPALHPCSEVCWFSDDMDYFTDLTLDLLPDCNLSSVLPEYSLCVGKALEIGTEEIDNTWLIPPSKTNEFKALIKEILYGEMEGVDEGVREKVRKSVASFAGSEEEFWRLEWCCMTWAAGGSVAMIGYPCFKAYLRSLAEEGDKREDDLLLREEWWGYAFVKSREDE